MTYYADMEKTQMMCKKYPFPKQYPNQQPNAVIIRTVH